MPSILIQFNSQLPPYLQHQHEKLCTTSFEQDKFESILFYAWLYPYSNQVLIKFHEAHAQIPVTIVCKEDIKSRESSKERIFPRDEQLIHTDALTGGCHLPARKRKFCKKLGNRPGSNFPIRIQVVTDSLCHAGGNVAASWLPRTQTRGAVNPVLTHMAQTQRVGSRVANIFCCCSQGD